MKKTRLLLVALGLLTLIAVTLLTGCTGSAATQTGGSTIQFNQQSSGFWVSGKGEITVTPNLATLSVGVESTETNVADAQAKAEDGINNILKALKDNNIDLKDIQTGSFYISQRLNYNSYSSTIVGYTVTNMLNVKIRDINTTGDIIKAAIAAGGDIIRVNNLSFSVEDPSEYFKQAREKAIANAKDKAQQYAQLMGVKLGSPTYVSESTQQSNPYYYNGSNYYSGNVAPPVAQSSDSSSISPGQNTITLSISVAYEMLK